MHFYGFIRLMKFSKFFSYTNMYNVAIEMFPTIP